LLEKSKQIHATVLTAVMQAGKTADTMHHEKAGSSKTSHLLGLAGCHTCNSLSETIVLTSRIPRRLCRYGLKA